MYSFKGDFIKMVDKYLIYFYLLSFVGYIYECTAMIIWTGKWENRGFLFGPMIPIYGAGALAGTLLFTYGIKDYSYLQVFLIGMIGSAILEYIVHYTLEKAFNAYWWDYSKSPLNINGRICLPASIGFGVAALVIVYIINPIVIPIIMNMNDMFVQLLALFLTVLFTIDFTLTISTLSSFMQRISDIDNYVNEHMDELVGSITDESKGINTAFYNAVDTFEDKIRKLQNTGLETFNRNYRKAANKIKGFKGLNSKRREYILHKIKVRLGIIDKDE